MRNPIVLQELMEQRLARRGRNLQIQEGDVNTVTLLLTLQWFQTIHFCNYML